MVHEGAEDEGGAGEAGLVGECGITELVYADGGHQQHIHVE